jgi:malonyl CoA-acyl carrier protein transacylase/nucleoside-diphosphate-sugar epimerase/acyl carrier protein/SAM-dependent methyltransferase
MQQLAEVESHGIDPGHIAVPANRPVILCFGGQISTWVGLSRDVYDGVAVFRGWLDECDKEVRANGCDSIFPGVFERDPITDPVKLQTMLFATQYACAKTWSDCGVQPVAVVGHSFGELTSLCISGVLSLQDTVKLIAGRARIIKELWGDDSGSMIAIETDIAQVQAIISEAQGACDNAGEKTPTIACFNGPTSFTVAGSTKAIDLVAQILVQTPRYTGVRHKRLNVTNAFHSTLVEPLKQQLVDLGRGLNFNAKPTIPLERATESQSIEELTAQYIADHMRNPVYFDHAVQRLVRKYPGAVWLEAGSNSTITNMASRALGQPKGHFFQPVNINSNSGLQFLTTATMGLWGEGLSQLTFWAHHRKQTYDYVPMLLPAYQFEKSRHWVELKVPQAIQQATPENQDSSDEVANTLWTFAGFQDEKNHSAKFVVNSESAIYKELMSGHLIAKTAPILPATVIVQIVVDALASVLPDVTESGLQPVLTNVENQSPVCVDPSRTLSIEVQAKGESIREWNWQLISTGSNKTTTHAVGAVVYISPEDAQSHHEFGRCERLISHKRCARLLQDDESDIIQGRRHIYKAFSDVVDYPEPYQGVTKLVGGDVESAGLVAKSHSVDGWVDPHLSDSFSQVGGIWVNSMSNSSTDDMFLATGFEKWMRNPRLSLLDYRQIKKWDVFGTHQAESENVWISDLFIFNSATGKLAEVILGIHYHRVAKSSMSKILQRLSHSSALTSAPVITGHDSKDDKREVKTAETLPGGMAVESAATVKPEGTTAKAAASSGPSEGQKVVSQARALLADMAGIEGNEINATTQLADIGIDSLMGMELARELEGLFKCKLPVDDLMEVYDFGQLARLVQEKLGVSADEEVSEPEKAVDSSDDDSGYGSRTPASTLISESHVAVTHDNARSQSLELSPSIIMEAFEETKKLTDDFITDYRCAGYMENVLPRQTQLCIALTLDALDKLGYPLRTAKPGQRLTRIPCIKEQILLSNHLYGMLEKEARLIDVSMEGSEEVIVRTAMSATPYKSISGIMAGLDRDFPDHKWANELTHFAGSQLAEVLSGGQDGLKLIFGTEEGRKLVTGLYGDSLLNKLANVQMQDVIARLISKMPKDQGPLKILELGAGTGGTSKGMAAMLAKLNVPVEYTFTDLSGSFVAQARKAFKEYPFMKFRVHNIEHVPADELIGTQHIVLGSNAIHATHNLQESTKNVHKMLRPDGFLMMLEMTDPVYWVDMIFGLFEGWWLFEDGRSHAIAHESVWERDLHSAGYGHVDWTDGHLPEIKIQKVFLAMASGPRYDRQPLPHRTPVAAIEPPTTAQIATVEAYVTAHTRGFNGPATLPSAKPSPSGTTVMVTGASGSLGTHLVALLASLPTVKTVVCLNRRSTTEPELRQQRAMSDRGILLDAASQAKLQVIQTDTAKPQLGLSPDEYERLVGSVTHIVHNAWPMSGKRPLAAMESQFTVMRNLVDLASDIAGRSHARVGFQLVSSIAVVGHYPLLPTGDRIVPEVSMPLDAVLPNGYGEAKFVCERILDQTLHRFPDRFHTMSARLGQVGGSRVSGYWNPVEHLAFLFKSSQTLRAFPAFEGDLCWTPVEDVAGTLADLLLYDGEAPASKFYHVDNPVRQPWAEMVPVLVDALGIPADGVVPFDEWVRKVRAFPGAVDSDNPAARLVEFLDDNFLRMSCGGLLLDTKKSCEHSPTLRAVGPISPSLARKYIQAWKGIGFLN